MTEITQAHLKSILDYDPQTGVFVWKNNVRFSPRAWKIAGSKDNQGYIRIQINQKLYKAHRLAWLYVHGSFPEKEIDHINHQRADNRIANLRSADRVLNTQNTSARKRGTSSLLGVSLYKPTGQWTAQISANKRKVYLGRYATEQEAHAAYMKAKAIHHGIGGEKGGA